MVNTPDSNAVELTFKVSVTGFGARVNEGEATSPTTFGQAIKEIVISLVL